MVVVKRGAGTTDDRSGLVYALEHRFRGRYISTLPHNEANPLLVSQLLASRCAYTVGHYFKKIRVPREEINIRPKSSLGIISTRGEKGILPTKNPSLGRMAQNRKHPGLVRATPWADFAPDHCSTLIKYNSNLSMCGTFFKKMLPLPDNRELLSTPRRTYNLNFSTVTLRIW